LRGACCAAKWSYTEHCHGLHGNSTNLNHDPFPPRIVAVGVLCVLDAEVQPTIDLEDVGATVPFNGLHGNTFFFVFLGNSAV
jgi:hypothetical protein